MQHEQCRTDINLAIAYVNVEEAVKFYCSRIRRSHVDIGAELALSFNSAGPGQTAGPVHGDCTLLALSLRLACLGNRVQIRRRLYSDGT